MAKCPKCNEELPGSGQFFIRSNSTIVCKNCNYKIQVDDFSYRLIAITAALLIFIPPILADLYVNTVDENFLLILRMGYMALMLALFLTSFPKLIIKISVSKKKSKIGDVD